MEKPKYKSKTLWAIGILALTLLAEAFGITESTTWLEVIKILAGSFGLYGLRDALK